MDLKMALEMYLELDVEQDLQLYLEHQQIQKLHIMGEITICL